MPPLPPITQALILINVAVFCLDQFLGMWFTRLFALWPLGGGFMPWQMASYAFLHGGIGHLFFNMLGLWMFGAELERLWGTKRFVQFYGASVLAAAVAQLLVAWRPLAPRAACSACCWPSACCSRTAPSCRCSRRSR